jgi:hypothetical protein
MKHAGEGTNVYEIRRYNFSCSFGKVASNVEQIICRGSGFMVFCYIESFTIQREKITGSRSGISKLDDAQFRSSDPLTSGQIHG